MNYDITDFQTEVIEESKTIPVLVDFWAEWCGPCKMLGPVLEKLAERHKGEWKLAKLDTDRNQQLAADYGIRGIPNVKLFINGEVVNEFSGALSEHMVEDWLRKNIPGKFSSLIEKAKQLITSGDNADAKTILEKILNESPDEKDAKLLLAKIELFNDPGKTSELLKNVEHESENYELLGSIGTISNLLLKLNNRDQLPGSIVREKYLSAIEELKNKNFDSALEKFINVIREEKSYDDEGARKSCIAIFKFLGEENEITLRHRRDFGSALYI